MTMYHQMFVLPFGLHTSEENVTLQAIELPCTLEACIAQ